MKKLSVLIALALVLTIGGAYATWTYLTGEMVAVDEEMAVAMGGLEELNTPYGTYKIDSIPTYIVEPKSATNRVTTLQETKNDEGESTSPDLVITFTPATNAEDTVKNNAIPTVLTIEIDDENPFGTYNDGTSDRTIIAINTASVELNWEKGDDGVFTATITSETFMTYLNLTEITLGTVEAYEAYAAALASGKIILTVDAQ